MACDVVALKRDGQQAVLALPASTCAQHLHVVCCAPLKLPHDVGARFCGRLQYPLHATSSSTLPPAFQGRLRSGWCAGCAGMCRYWMAWSR